MSITKSPIIKPGFNLAFTP